MGDSPIQTHPVGPGELGELARLFQQTRNTRRCWCMAPCSDSRRFALGWLTGGNRSRFEAMTAASTEPVGILATVATEPIGWCACGPRSRYVGSATRHNQGLRERNPSEDDAVWLVACVFIRPDHRSRGVSHALLRSAIGLATNHGARAIEAWPTAEPDPGNGFLGREELFRALGFSRTAQPVPGRTVWRLELGPPP